MKKLSVAYFVMLIVCLAIGICWPSLLILAAVTLLSVILIMEKWQEAGSDSSDEKKVAGFLNCSLAVVIVIFGFAFWLLYNFTHPRNNQYYTNARATIFEHTGYEFQDSLVLFNDKDPVNSLSEHELGALIVHSMDHAGARLYERGLHHPLYYKQNDSPSFVILNPVYEAPVNTSLMLVKQNDTLNLSICKVEQSRFCELQPKFYYIFHKGGKNDTSGLSTPINAGYQLAELVNKTPEISISNEMRDLLEGSWLVRRNIYPAGKKDNYLTSQLLLYPSAGFMDDVGSISVYVDGIQITPCTGNGQKDTALRNNDLFFTGVSGEYRSPIYLYKNDGGRRQLRFLFSKKYALKDTVAGKEVRIAITTAEDTLMRSATGSAFFLGTLKNAANSNHISGTLSYAPGAGSTALIADAHDNICNAQCLNKDNIDSTVEFNLTCANRKNAWLFCLRNMNSTNGVTFKKMASWLGIYAALSVLIICFYRFKRDLDNSNVNPFEIVILLVVFVFSVIRFLFKWRAGMFPPLDITEHEYTALRQINSGFSEVSVQSSIDFAAACILAFYIILLLRSILISFMGKLSHGNTFHLVKEGAGLRTNKRRFMWALFPVQVIISVAAIVIVLFFSRFAVFGGLVCPFISIIYSSFIFKQAAIANNNNFNKWLAKFSGLIFLCTLVPWIGFLIWRDMGFAFIFILAFLTYGAICSLIPRLETVIKKPEWAMRNKMLNNGMLIPIALAIVLVVCVYIFLFISVPWAAGRWDKFNNTRYRAELINSNIEDVLENVGSANEQVKFFNTAHNQWLINEYNNNSSYFGGWDIQPHTAIGANYLTQTNDLVMLRYGIAEHGRLLPVILVIIFAVFIFFRIRFNFADTQLTRPAFNMKIRPQDNASRADLNLNIDLFLLLFLFNLAFFVSLSASNNFIFIGQDFPFLSFNSAASLIYVLVILLAIIAFKFPFQHFNSNKPEKNSYRSGRIIALRSFRIAVAIFFLLWVFINPNKSAREDMGISTYFIKADSMVTCLNKEFIPFQHRHYELTPDTLLSRFTDSILSGHLAYLNLNDMNVSASYPEIFPYQLNTFYRPLWFVPFRTQNVTYLNVSALNREFTKLNNSKDKFNNNSILYLRYTDNNGSLKFELNRKYYTLKSLFRKEYWQGAIVDHNNAVLAKTMWINGRTEHLYPERERLLWAYDLDNYISSNINKDSLTTKSVQASFDMRLTDSLDEYLTTHSDTGVFEIHNARGNRSLFEFESLPFSRKKQPNYTGYKIICSNGVVRLADDSDRLSCAIFNRETGVVDSLYKTGNYMLLKRVINEKIDAILDSGKRQSILVVALDGDGKTRVLLDHNYEYKPDPNHLSQYFDLLNTSTLSNDMLAEQDKLVNGCLLTDDQPGHGSALKPFMYSAVTSQYDMEGGWERFGVIYKNREPIECIDTPGIHYYAGQRVHTKWETLLYEKLLTNNELNGKRYALPEDYLAKSNNLYHSVIMSIGSYTGHQLDAMRRASVSELSTTDKFPEMLLGEVRSFYFVPRITRGSFSNAGSLLSVGLKENYGIITASADTTRDSLVIPGLVMKKGALSFRKFILPERSTFIQSDRNKDKLGRPCDIDHINPQLTFIEGLKKPSLGDAPVEITPLKVAELAGRMATLNRNFKYSFFETTHNIYEPFHYNGIDSVRYFTHYKADILAPLTKIFNNGTLNGMAGNGSGVRYMKNDTCFITNDANERFYVYGKSGTSSGDYKNNLEQNRNGIFIISKTDMRTLHSIDALRQVKYYTVYTMFRKIRTLGKENKMTNISKARNEILSMIVNSKSFKDYMR